MIIRIKNLRLRALIGVNPWERNDKQAVIVNAEVEFDGAAAAESDNLDDTIDYRSFSKKVIDCVENSDFKLIEALAGKCLSIIMEDPKVTRARVEIDKPNAVKSADSTSVEVSATRTPVSAT
jgi:D-erythro-7,8-dihydroneopterin triphosphate epimerase